VRSASSTATGRRACRSGATGGSRSCGGATRAARAGSCPAPAGPGSTRSIQSGGWRGLDAVPVDIPASLGLDHGVWFRVRQGVRGLLVPDERGIAVVYMICEPSSHYYQVMTRSHRMPVLIEERI
jgi:hypothetical protein